MRRMVAGETRDPLTELRRGVLEHCVLALMREKESYAFEIVRALSDAGGLVTKTEPPPDAFSESPIALAIDDDLLNQALFALWHGGALTNAAGVSTVVALSTPSGHVKPGRHRPWQEGCVWPGAASAPTAGHGPLQAGVCRPVVLPKVRLGHSAGALLPAAQKRPGGQGAGLAAPPTQ